MGQLSVINYLYVEKRQTNDGGLGFDPHTVHRPPQPLLAEHIYGHSVSSLDRTSPGRQKDLGL